MDAGEIETSADALGHATDKALKTAAAALGSGGVKLSTHGLMIVGFLKSQLQTGCVFSVPEAIFATLQNKCEPDEGPEEETAGNFTLEDIAGALIPRDVAIRKAEDHVYSYVVDAQPERRHQQLGVGKVANRSVIHCIRFMQVNLQDPEQPRVSYTSVQRHDLDLSAVATLEMMSSACVIWLPQCTSLQVKLLPELSDSSTGHALQAPLRLPALTSDQDTLWDLAQDDREQQELEFLVPANPGIDVSADMLSQQEQALVETLFQRKAVADNFVRALGLAYFGTAAATSLAERGILRLREDDFGDVQVSLTEQMQVRGVVTLIDPVSLAHHEPQMQNSAGRNKLSWLKQLLMQEWRLFKAGRGRKTQLQWRHKDSTPELPANMLSRPESHFKALAFEATIFEKPGGLTKISHCGSSAYLRTFADDTRLDRDRGVDTRKDDGVRLAPKEKEGQRPTVPCRPP